MNDDGIIDSDVYIEDGIIRYANAKCIFIMRRIILVYITHRLRKSLSGLLKEIPRIADPRVYFSMIIRFRSVLIGSITVYSAHVSNRHSTQTKRDTFVVAVILSLKCVYVCYDLSNERD